MNDVLCSLPQNPWPAQYYGQYSLSHHTLLLYEGKKHITLFFNREIYLQGLSGLVFSRVVDSACKSCQEKQKHVRTGATSNCSRVGQTEREKENYF